MRRGTPAYLRLPHLGRALYVEVIGQVALQYCVIAVTAELGVPGWRKGSQHLVPVSKLTRRRRGRHVKRKWWHW